MSDEADSWARLKTHYAKSHPQLSKTALERVAPIAASYASDVPSLCDPALEPLRLLLHNYYSHPDVDHREDVLRVWMAHGAAFATEMLVASCRFEVMYEEARGFGDCEVSEGLEMGAWQAFCRQLAVLDAGGFAAAQDCALRLAEGAPAALRCALAMSFSDQDILTREEKRAGVFAHQYDRCFRPYFYILACTPAIDVTKVKALRDIPLLERTKSLGELACGPLRARISDYWTDAGVVKKTIKAIAKIDHQDAAHACVRLLHKHHAAEVAVRRLWSQPEQAIIAVAGWLIELGDGAKEREQKESAEEALRALLRAHPEAVANAELPEASAALVEAYLNKISRFPQAAPQAFLASLPWKAAETASGKKKVKKARAKKVPAPALLEYEEVIRFQKKEVPKFRKDSQDPDFDAELLRRIRDGDHRSLWQATCLTKEAAAQILTEVEPRDWYAGEDDIRRALSLIGLDSLDVLLVICKRLGDCLVGLSAVDSPRVAPLMANAQTNLKKTRGVGEKWLRRFPEAAAVGLIPALYATGKTKKTAEHALRFVCEKKAKVVHEVAARYGEETALRVRSLMDTDGSPVAAATKPPKLPKFIRPDMLPAPVLSGGTQSLCGEDTLDLVRLLSVVEAEDAALTKLRAACDAESLAEFAWCLFHQWLLSGAPMKTKWPFFGLAHFGDARAARALGPLAKEWAPGGFPSRAQLAIDVLAAMGSDFALMEIYKTAERVRSRGLARHARKTLTDLAAARDLSMEELTDRLVPDLGLDEDGTTQLSYGEKRSFSVRFDEQLKPQLYGAEGKVMKSLPRANKQDDETLVAEAKAHWKYLKKEAKAIAGERIRQLERAMCEGRSWSHDEFLSFFARHALLFNLATRIVWSSGDIFFRLCADGTFADENDDAVALPRAPVGIPHPQRFDAASLRQWGTLFADYDLLQPFEQLGREVYASDEAEKLIEEAQSTELSTTRLMRLRGLGWEEAESSGGGRVSHLTRFIGEASAALEMSPGIYLGEPQMEPVQTVQFAVQSDALLLSEVARDIARLTQE